MRLFRLHRVSDRAKTETAANTEDTEDTGNTGNTGAVPPISIRFTGSPLSVRAVESETGKRTQFG